MRKLGLREDKPLSQSDTLVSSGPKTMGACTFIKCLLCAGFLGLFRTWGIQQIIEQILTALLFWAVGRVQGAGDGSSLMLRFPGKKTKAQKGKTPF